jgi:hypothetical protein
MKGMRRPKAVVLPANAVVPDANLVRPPPNQFTHELVRDQAYYFTSARKSVAEDGRFPAGTRVVLMLKVGNKCRVIDGQGLYVEIECTSLKALPG